MVDGLRAVGFPGIRKSDTDKGETTMNLRRREVFLELLINSECFTPDSTEPGNYSVGAEFMDSVAVNLIEAIEYRRIVSNEERAEDGEYREDVINEIAAGSVPVSTYEMWLAFVDLGAYSTEWEEAEHFAYDDMNSRATNRLIYLAEDAIRGVLTECFDRD